MTFMDATTTQLISELRKRISSTELSSTADIIHQVSQITGVCAELILGIDKTRHVCYARYICIHQLRKHNPFWTLQKTALQFRKDHVSIIHSQRRYKDLYENNEQFKAIADECDKIKLP